MHASLLKTWRLWISSLTPQWVTTFDLIGISSNIQWRFPKLNHQKFFYSKKSLSPWPPSAMTWACWTVQLISIVASISWVHVNLVDIFPLLIGKVISPVICWMLHTCIHLMITNHSKHVYRNISISNTQYFRSWWTSPSTGLWTPAGITRPSPIKLRTLTGKWPAGEQWTLVYKTAKAHDPQSQIKIH